MENENVLLEIVREAVSDKAKHDVSALKEVARYLDKEIEERSNDPEALKRDAEEWAKTLPDKEQK